MLRVLIRVPFIFVVKILFINEIMKSVETYNKRTWLNKKSSPSTGNVICFDGYTTYHGEKKRNIFLQISDCNWATRLHKSEDDSVVDFVDKMKLLHKEIGDFIDYLENNL